MPESTQSSIPCRVGLSPSGAWIESPRTGKRLSITREIVPSLPRVWGRIHQKVSVGDHRVDFSRDELLAIKAHVDAFLEHEAQKNDDPPLHFGMKYAGISDYCEFCLNNRAIRAGGYALRPDDTFLIDCHTTDWPPMGLGLWFRHPCGPAMVVAGEAMKNLPDGIAEKFNNGKRATFTGAELNWLYAASTATSLKMQPVRRRTIRRYRGF